MPVEQRKLTTKTYLAIEDARGAIQDMERRGKVKTVKDRLFVAMMETVNHRFEEDDSSRLRAALVATLMECNEIEKAELDAEILAVSVLSDCLAQSKPFPEGFKFPDQVNGFVGIWEAVKQQTRKPQRKIFDMSSARGGG